MLDLPALPRASILAAVIGGFFVVGLLVYGSSLHNEFVRWDDGMLIYENPAVREITPSSLTWIFTHFDPELYIPVTFFSYQIDYQIGGHDPFIYHFHSLLYHIGSAILLAFIVFMLTRRWDAAILCGGIFLLHPLHTEAVAWASGRKDVLSTFGFLAAILSYLLYLRDDRRLWMYLSLGFFLAALLSKVMVATLPVVLYLIDVQIRRPMDRKSLVYEKIPYFLLSFIFVAVAFFGKRVLVASTPLATKIFMALKSTAFYFGKILVPAKFSLLYPYTGTPSFASVEFLNAALVVLALIIAGLMFWKRARWVTVGIAWYLVTLGPTFFNLGNKSEMDVYFASDRYAYVPSIGLFFVIAMLISTVLSRYRVSRFTWSEIAGTVLLTLLAFLSFRQSKVWTNTETLFANVIRHYPASSHVAYNNLGNMYRLQGDIDRAIETIKKALALRPHPKTYSNLGAAYRKKKMYPEALLAYADALKIDPANQYAHFGLGIVHAEMGKNTEAEKEYKLALEKDPTYEQVHLNLGALYANEGRLDEAIAEYEKALAINEFFPDARYNLGVAYSAQGKIEEAIEQYEWTVRMAPMSIPPRINLGILYSQTGETEKSIEQFRKILDIDPGNGAARSALQQLGASQ